MGNKKDKTREKCLINVVEKTNYKMNFKDQFNFILFKKLISLLGQILRNKVLASLKTKTSKITYYKKTLFV